MTMPYDEDNDFESDVVNVRQAQENRARLDEADKLVEAWERESGVQKDDSPTFGDYTANAAFSARWPRATIKSWR